MAFLTQSDRFVAAFSSPSDSIATFSSPAGNAVQDGPSINEHPGGITGLKTDPISPFMLWSSGVDGFVKGFDLRTSRGGPSATLAGGFARARSFMSFDISPDGRTVAAGTDQNNEDASIAFWDIRHGSRPSTIHTSTHSEDVTVLAFHPNSNILLSGGMDGLVSITNVQEPDEDEAVIHVANWGCSVAKAGWIGGEHQAAVWSTSDMETIALWSNELDPVHDYGEIKRENTHNWYADYVVSTEWMEPSTQSPWGLHGLVSWWGTNEGSLSQLNHDMNDRHRNWSLRRILKGGHQEIIRCLCWDQQGRVIATGGEDGKISLWSSTTDADGDVDMAPNSPPAHKRRLSGPEAEPKALKRQRLVD